MNTKRVQQTFRSTLHPLFAFLWSRWAELNCRPTPYHGVALPLSYIGLGPPKGSLGEYGICPKFSNLFLAADEVETELLLRFDKDLELAYL